MAQHANSTLKSSSNPNSTSTTAPSIPTNDSKNIGKTSEVNVVQSVTANKSSKAKKKGKGKAKSDTHKQYSSKSSIDDESKPKPKYPCLICDDNHYTKDFPRCAEVSHILKFKPGTLNVLKEPFSIS